MSDLFDSDRPGYSADRIYEAADRIGKERRENLAPPDVVAVDGVTRYACPEGCGHFGSMTERDLHVLVEHDRTAA